MTRSLELPLDVVVSESEVHAVGQVTIKQTDFGITPPSALGGRVRATDAIVLTFDIVARASD
ncbi:hypothetical protein D3C83_212780 [compost metagenome]